MKGLASFILGLVIGAAGAWFYFERGDKDSLEIRTSVDKDGSDFRSNVRGKMDDLSLRAEDIKEELQKSGRVVRRKARDVGAAVADATADARITAAVKSKYATEAGVSAIGINVSTEAGVVTLAGNVDSSEEIAKAMRIALDTEGVREVVSNLQLKQGR